MVYIYEIKVEFYFSIFCWIHDKLYAIIQTKILNYAYVNFQAIVVVVVIVVIVIENVEVVNFCKIKVQFFPYFLDT